MNAAEATVLDHDVADAAADAERLDGSEVAGPYRQAVPAVQRQRDRQPLPISLILTEVSERLPVRPPKKLSLQSPDNETLPATKLHFQLDHSP